MAAAGGTADAVDLVHLLSYQFPPHCVHSLWNSLSKDSQRALRSTCRGIRDLVDSQLSDRATLELVHPASFTASQFSSYLERRRGRALELRLCVAEELVQLPDVADQELRHVFGLQNHMGSVQHLFITTPLAIAGDRSLDMSQATMALIPTHLPNLSSITLSGCSMTPAALAALAACASLKSFCTVDLHLVDSTPSTPILLPPSLQELELVGYEDEDGSADHLDLSSFQNLPQLQHLNKLSVTFYWCSNPSVVQSLTALTHLELARIPCADLSFLPALPQLEVLILSSQAYFPASSLQTILKMKSLKNVQLTAKTGFGNVPWSPVQSTTLPRLEWLVLSGSRPLQTLHSFLMAGCNLQYVRLFEYQNSCAVVPLPGALDGGVGAVVEMLQQVSQRLADIPETSGMLRLELDGQGAALDTPSFQPYLPGLAPLTGHPHVQQLALRNAKMSAAVVEELGRLMPQLSELVLQECEMEVPRTFLPALAGHPGLRKGGVKIDACWGGDHDTVEPAATVALAMLALEMRVRVTNCDWWDEDHDTLVLDMQARLRRQGGAEV